MNADVVTLIIVVAVIWLWTQYKTPSAQATTAKQTTAQYYNAAGGPYSGETYSYWYNTQDQTWYQGCKADGSISIYGPQPPWSQFSESSGADAQGIGSPPYPIVSSEPGTTLVPITSGEQPIGIQPISLGNIGPFNSMFPETPNLSMSGEISVPSYYSIWHEGGGWSTIYIDNRDGSLHYATGLALLPPAQMRQMIIQTALGSSQSPGTFY